MSLPDEPQNIHWIRASSLPDLIDCPARWYARNVEKMKMPTSSAAWLGTSLHRATAVFDAGGTNGEYKYSSPEAATTAFMYEFLNPDEDVDWSDNCQKKMVAPGLYLTQQYCTKIAPKYHFAGVEVSCEPLYIQTKSGSIIRLTGTTDRIILKNGKYSIADIKSGKRAVSKEGIANVAGHEAQLGVYTLLAERSAKMFFDGDAEILGLNTGKTIRGCRVGTATVKNHRTALIGTEKTPGLLDVAGDILKTGNFYGNPRSYLCSKKYCPAFHNCKYRG